MTEVQMTGFVTAHMDVRTAEDVRTLAGWLNRYNVPNSVQVDWDCGRAYVELTGDTSVPAEWIECGDHVPPASAYDILINTHSHANDHEAPSRPAKYDWPAQDRAKKN